MTDYISREMTIDAICRLCNANFEEDPCEPSECEMMLLLRKIPAADVRPVVMCRDCKYSYDSVGGWCCSHGICVDCIVREDFFCADGEKREES